MRSSPLARRLSPAVTKLRGLADPAVDAVNAAAGIDTRVDALTAAAEPADVVLVGVYEAGSLLARQIDALLATRHRVRVALGAFRAPADPALARWTVAEHLDAPLFENLNRLLADPAVAGPAPRWIIRTDSDVGYPPGFLDRFLAVAAHADLALAQPALTRGSFTAWPIVRRRARSLARETRFVEIGPVNAFRADAAELLLPFPEDAGMGWGMDLHWPAVLGAAGLRLGIVDATPVTHDERPPAAGYSAAEATAAQQRFLDGRPSLPREQAVRTVRTVRA